MSNKTEVIIFDEIGPVEFKRNRTSKRLSIYIKPFKGVVVVMPLRYSLKTASTFVDSKKDWILESLSKMKKYENQRTLFDENSNFHTRSFRLRVVKHNKPSTRLQLKDGILTASYPLNEDVYSDDIQENIRFGIIEALRIEAKNFLPQRVSYFASKYGFKYRKVFIKNLKSRWGSCSSVDNINLNLHLMRLPSHLIDYVILHELCHTIEKNHGPNFWSLLDKYCDGRAKELSKEMRNYRTTIF